MAASDDYLEHIAKLPRGDAAAGEIELLGDRPAIEAASASVREELARRGEPASWADIGEVYRDRYLVIYRDAVRFRTGRAGTYIRLATPAPADDGVVGVVAVIERADAVGHTLFTRNFRHATRRWELELPRGGRPANLSISQAALMEAREETGYADVIGEPRELGRFVADSGMGGGEIAVVRIVVGGARAASAIEEAESIDAEVRWLDDGEVVAAIADGRLRDGVTISAWALARAVAERSATATET